MYKIKMTKQSIHTTEMINIMRVGSSVAELTIEKRFLLTITVVAVDTKCSSILQDIYSLYLKSIR